MTNKELTKAVVSIYRKACADMEALIKSQSVPVYTNMYGMRRWFKHNDNSQMVVNGRELMRDIDGGRVKLSKGNMLVQATPESVKKEYRIQTIPVGFEIDGHLTFDGELTPDKIIDKFYEKENKKMIIRTTPPTEDEYYAFFLPHIYMGNLTVAINL